MFEILLNGFPTLVSSINLGGLSSLIMKLEKPHLGENHLSVEADRIHRSFSDQELWVRFCRGEQGAFAFIYKEYIKDLYNFVFQLCRDEDYAKDLIQDVFVRLRFSKSKSEVKSIKSYLFKCTYNEWISRAKSSSTFASLPESSDSFGITVSFEDRLIENEIGGDRIKYLKEALDSLTTKQRKGIMLFFYEGMSYEEVAEVLSLKNAKSARKLIYRALDRLRPNDAVMSILYSFLI